MSYATPICYTPEENAVFFFRQVKNDLGISSSLKLVKLVGKVIAHIRKDLSITQILQLVNHLPGVFQLMMMDHPRQLRKKKQSSYAHLDEFVESLYEEDKRSNNSVFTTEVEALRVVVVVLKRMDKYLNLFSYNILKYPVLQELEQVPLDGI